MADEPAASEDEAATPEEVETTLAADDSELLDEPAQALVVKSGWTHVRLALVVGTVIVVALGGLAGWLGYRAYDAKKTDQLRELLVSVGRQGAINLTTIHFDEADKDVQRILDSATDAFYDDFAKRSQPFIEVVKQAQSKSDGQVTEAGLESMTGDQGQVLVAVTVTTSNAGAPNQPPRSWRMRLTVKKTGNDEAKVSKVEFVP
ncbi:Mce protein [Mycolicibacterium helvum]|uniref:Mce associated membrane protein n=1 Tax=Mycolicibacterium helvum TaxID=1534349 RepID=A0A7I7T2L8_9MYCO|nr:Mce protein [Mycolicibacterium helvum]BBY62719.1 hypothetical protein MHEL_09620 [Mycolicibacterium helvum]